MKTPPRPKPPKTPKHRLTRTQLLNTLRRLRRENSKLIRIIEQREMDVELNRYISLPYT